MQLYTNGMTSLVLAVLALLLAAGPDPAKVEQFLRYFYNWPQAAVNVKVGELQRSPIQGLFQTVVELSDKEGKKVPAKITFYVSEDGKYVLEGPVVSTADPYREMRASIDLKGQPAFGALLPKITIVEYGDLQCGYCKQMSAVLRNELQREFGSLVRVYVKDYPLTDIHPWAKDAAVIGRCVLQQKEETFWAYHDWAYQKQEELNAANLREKASAFLAEKKVDAARLEACLKAPEARSDVERSVREAQVLNINSTPTLFVNGRRLVGSQTYATLRQVILLELERIKQLEGSL